MLYARFSLERLEHTVHLKSKTEVRERSLQHVGFFIRKSRRYSSRHQHGMQPEERCWMQEESESRMERGHTIR